MVSTLVLLLVAGTVTTTLMNMTTSQLTVWNRTEMHSGVRSATELLQQEVGQAGRVSLPGAVTTTGAVGAAGAATIGVSSVAGMFVGEQVTVDTGSNRETVTLTVVDTAATQITGTFAQTHAANVPISVQGGFASGIVPTTAVNGSTGTVLKLYGDINGDNTMVYIEYTCDTAVNNKLYRNSMAYDAAGKPALTAAMVLLDNIQANPNGTPCFTYQQQVVGANTYVTDVAITLTVQTQNQDPTTRQFQQETKALLNVAPRNIFNTWELASAGGSDRIQPMPPTVTALLP
jgi:hypothetical protein